MAFFYLKKCNFKPKLLYLSLQKKNYQTRNEVERTESRQKFKDNVHTKKQKSFSQTKNFKGSLRSGISLIIISVRNTKIL